METKAASLSIYESFPFPVKYHQEDGESVCTVKQEDLEALYKAYRWTARFGVFLGVAAIAFALCVGYLVINPATDIRVVPIPANQLQMTSE